MTLDELIAELEKHNPDRAVPLGFHHPHSYRGYYDELAFEPTADTTIGEMLSAARAALGSTFQGWKGGDYTMRGYTDCWLAEEGHCGETLGEHFVRLLLAQAPPEADTAAAPFTDAETAWMQLAGTPALQGLRAELRIDGYPPLIGRYCGSALGRMRNHPNMLSAEPQLAFEYPAGEAAATDEEAGRG